MKAFHEHELLIFDGACGTNLQRMAIPHAAWDGHEGCNEYLNLSAPDTIVELHRQFIEAGAQVLETNTFGSNAVVLAEYGLEGRVEELNRVAVELARRAIAGRPERYVAGSIGPGTKLASLGHIEVGVLAESYRTQMRALIEAGVDALIIETCQDLLQIKTAARTALDALTEARRDLPVLVSVTVEQTGTLLVGSDIAAVCATLEPFPLFSLGLNCATGPQAMESHIRLLSRQWPRRVSCMPNQGLPEVVDGQTVYPLSPDAYALAMRHFVERDGVSIVGGCCGTTPAHIARLATELKNVRPGARDIVA